MVVDGGGGVVKAAESLLYSLVRVWLNNCSSAMAIQTSPHWSQTILTQSALHIPGSSVHASGQPTAQQRLAALQFIMTIFSQQNTEPAGITVFC